MLALETERAILARQWALHREALERTARRYAKPHDVDDVLQQTFFLLFRRPSRFSARKRSAEAYLRGAVKRRALSTFRVRNSWLPITEAGSVTSPHPGPSAAAEAGESADILRRALLILDSETQRIAQLAIGEGYAAAAEALGVSAMAVKHRMRRHILPALKAAYRRAERDGARAVRRPWRTSQIVKATKVLLSPKTVCDSAADRAALAGRILAPWDGEKDNPIR